MNYAVFSQYTMGRSHEKCNMGCEDYAGHYCDPQGRFAAAVVCDGHSDPRCFRSDRGARFGCQAALEILQRFFEAYCQEEPEQAWQELQSGEQEVLRRLKAAILQKWNRKVEEDLTSNPPSSEEMAPLREKKYQEALQLYQAGKGLSNLYGATFLAVAVCTQFHLALQIGDGALVCLEGEGRYTAPLPDDPKGDLGGPASLCDRDLLSREGAFRGGIFPGLPQALYVMSDGVGDMPLSLSLRETLFSVQQGLSERGESDGTEDLIELNQSQRDYLTSFLRYHAERGVEDDCSFAGMYRRNEPVFEVAVEPEELEELYRRLEEQQQQVELTHQKNQANLAGRIQTCRKKVEELQRQREVLLQEIEQLERDMDTLEKEQDHLNEVSSRQDEYRDRQIRDIGQAREQLKRYGEAPCPAEGLAAEEKAEHNGPI